MGNFLLKENLEDIWLKNNVLQKYMAPMSAMHQAGILSSMTPL